MSVPLDIHHALCMPRSAVQHCSTLSRTRTLFGKYLLNTKCVFEFSVQTFFQTLNIIRRNERDMILDVYRPACEVPLYRLIVIQLGFSRQIFGKYSKIKFHENTFGRSRIVPCDRTDTIKLIVTVGNIGNVRKN